MIWQYSANADYHTAAGNAEIKTKSAVSFPKHSA